MKAYLSSVDPLGATAPPTVDARPLVTTRRPRDARPLGAPPAAAAPYQARARSRPQDSAAQGRDRRAHARRLGARLLRVSARRFACSFCASRRWCRTLHLCSLPTLFVAWWIACVLAPFSSAGDGGVVVHFFCENEQRATPQRCQPRRRRRRAVSTRMGARAHTPRRCVGMCDGVMARQVPLPWYTHTLSLSRTASP